MNKLPYSTMKRLLSNESGLRANHLAVEAFTKKIINFASKEATRISKIVIAQHRKTIYDYDVNNDSNIATDEVSIINADNITDNVTNI